MQYAKIIHPAPDFSLPQPLSEPLPSFTSNGDFHLIPKDNHHSIHKVDCHEIHQYTPLDA